MSSRTMVKLTSYPHGIEFRTFNREKESLSFYVRRDELLELERKEEVTVHDAGSFIVFRKDAAGELINIRFVWLYSSGDQLHGYEENLILLYGDVATFAENSKMAGSPSYCRLLSVAKKDPQPRYVFYCTERLHECLAVKAVRRKLVRFLRDDFRWPDGGQIQFDCGPVPYSFFFQVIREGRLFFVGGLILQGQEDMNTAYYSIQI